ncbi:MAG: hypothetical protein GW893_09265 [Armatimonadetes bacterium]|nr:hypothetical protein [Armatimonadota bacterium]
MLSGVSACPSPRDHKRLMDDGDVQLLSNVRMSYIRADFLAPLSPTSAHTPEKWRAIPRIWWG